MTRNAHEDGGSPPKPSAQSRVRAEFCGILTGFGSEEERQEPRFLWFTGSIWDGALCTWPRDRGLKGQRQAPLSQKQSAVASAPGSPPSRPSDSLLKPGASPRGLERHCSVYRARRTQTVTFLNQRRGGSDHGRM